MENKTWGLVLSGGGGKGAYQAGVLKAMEELGMLDRVEAIAGSSIGALNAVLLAQQDTKKMEEVWNQVTPEEILSAKISYEDVLSEIADIFQDVKEFLESETLDQFLKTARTDGICSRVGLIKIMDEFVDFDKVRSYPKEIYVTIAKVIDGVPVAEYHTLRDKSDQQIKKLLLASSALPIIYDAVDIDGTLYRDGGIADNVPMKPLRDRGLKRFYVLRHTEGKVTFTENSENGEQELLIRPSHEIGDFLSGTVDFSHKNILYRIALGYYDGLAIFEEQKRRERGKTGNSVQLQIRLSESHRMALAQNRRSELSEVVEKHLSDFSKYEHYYDKS